MKGSKEDGLRKQLLCKNYNIHPRKLAPLGGGFKALSNTTWVKHRKELRRGGKRRREKSLTRRDDQD